MRYHFVERTRALRVLLPGILLGLTILVLASGGCISSTPTPTPTRTPAIIVVTHTPPPTVAKPTTQAPTLAVTAPRREITLTISPSAMPSAEPSCGFISTSSSL